MNEIDHELLNEPVYSIGLAAEKLGVAVPTLRMYEQAGLIIPHRTRSQRRLYTRNDIKRLQVIIDLIRQQRLNIEAIKLLCSLTPCWKVINCAMEIREKCPAYQDDCVTPCWLVADKCREDRVNNCADCQVYLCCPKTIARPKEMLKKYL